MTIIIMEEKFMNVRSGGWDMGGAGVGERRVEMMQI